jgi:hypothetical protein
MNDQPDNSRRASKPRRWRQFGLRSLLLLILFIAVGLLVYREYYLKPYWQQRQAHIYNSMRGVLLTLYNWSDVYDTLPPATITNKKGLAISSWRYWTTPFFESPPHWPHVRDPWDAPENQETRQVRYGLFCWSEVETRAVGGPIDTGVWTEDAPPEAFYTNIFAITGPGTAFEAGKQVRLKDLPDSLILIVEVRNSGVHWMQPGDFDIRTMPKTINAPDGKGISGVLARGFHVGFADAQVWYLSNKVPFDDLSKFFTIEGAKAQDRDEVLGPYVLTRDAQFKRN